jgi:hypothetical protein
MPTKKRKNKRRGRTRRKKDLHGGWYLPGFMKRGQKSNDGPIVQTPEFDMDATSGSRNSIRITDVNDAEVGDDEGDFMGTPPAQDQTAPSAPPMDLGEDVKRVITAEDRAIKAEEFKKGRDESRKKKAKTRPNSKVLKQFGVSHDAEVINKKAFATLGLPPDDIAEQIGRQQTLKVQQDSAMHDSFLGGKRTRRRRRIKKKRG